MSQWEVCLLAKLHSGTCHSPWCCRTHSAGSSFLCSSGWGASYPPSQYRKYLPVRPGCKSIQNHSRFFVLEMGWDQVTQGVKIENRWELNIQLLGTRSNHNDFSHLSLVAFHLYLHDDHFTLNYCVTDEYIPIPTGSHRHLWPGSGAVNNGVNANQWTRQTLL